ncbi:MAG TPA: SUMF1/EgtB/PvdO family nonheme iron enzyme [Bryobacteraceae bacterium]|jgi:gamma-glutamyl hercynylcysteine S-oxide synthase|nr:SUMF1/EgtB/PvdO family nonheme iron enzyme [Bryobacteraceae bacterium]
MSTAMVASRALQERLDSARKLTDYVFSLLKPEALYSRPIPERHRLIFYLGHLEAFDWNLIARKTLDVPSFHPTFDKLFEFGIDPPVGQVASDEPSDWPIVDEVRGYNQRVRRALDQLIDQAPEEIIHVALEHRLMHAETLAYLLHNLPYDQKVRKGTPVPFSVKLLSNPMIEIAPGTATLGQKPGAFGWDNEFTEHQVDVPAFRVSKHKVTNGQYLDFVRAGGASPPHFWAERKSPHSTRWFYHGMFSPVPLPLNAPAYVTHAEATAYARAAGKSLPTEPQFHRAAYTSPASFASEETSKPHERPFPWGHAEPNAKRGNFDFHQWDPLDVDAHPAGDSAWGVSQLVGNGWEWTATKFGPFPGFEPRPFYPGYSQNFFDEEHYVMKGGSPVTAACMLRRSFRNWFRPNYPYVYASFRLVED